MVCMLTPNGEFSIASALSLVRSHSNRSLGAACIWHRSLPITISFFMFRLVSDRLPLLEQLRRFGVQGPSRCCCCIDPQEERLNHMFCTGEAARQVWKVFEIQERRSSRISSARHMAIAWWIQPAPHRYFAFVYRLLPSLICWELWRARTSALMQGGGYKVNTDGCSLGNPGMSGGGGLLRDSQEGFLFGFSCFFGVITSLHAELQALVYRVELDDLLRFQSLFQSITHCFREANKPSDRLAKMGATRGSDALFDSFVELPPMARGDIRMDRLGFPSFWRRIL
ncbi:uncharacterized protein [Coffea arabica]|uniref:Reverse transcriptase zinc-binding domain-containing protein n=1 Tax=Coffea arabica TaxID=13443 RepID=A0ABM4VUD1_COFAR